MRLGMWATNTDVCGESTALFNWFQHLQPLHDCRLFTTTVSGKRNKSISAPYPYEIVKSKDVGDYIKQFDLIVFYGAGSFYESLFEAPDYFVEPVRQKVPYVMSVASVPSLTTSAWSVMRTQAAAGVYFLRESIHDYVCLTQSEITDHRLVVKHPVDLSKMKAFNPHGEKLLFTGRAQYSKRIHTLLSAEDIHNPWPIEFRTDLEGRYAYLQIEQFGDRLTKRCTGGYSRDQLDEVYQNAKFMIDLTSFRDEPGGGIQNTGIESLMRGVPPITAVGWSPWGPRFEVDVKAPPEDLRAQINHILSRSQDEREDVVHAGQKYLIENHGPDQITKFSEWLIKAAERNT